MGGACRMHVEKTNAYIVLARIPKGRSLRRLRRRKNNIKMDLETDKKGGC